MLEKVNTIVWDWNGTLLDDTDLCISTINELLEERNLPRLNKERYHQAFGFPIIDYYRRIGFNFEKEAFETPAHQYIEKYSASVHRAQLHQGVHEVLKSFQQANFRQLVLSASEQQILEHSLNLFGIAHYFDAVAGLDNHYAASKTSLGISLLKKMNINAQRVCLIGDTIHDFEVASEMGCCCILIANGHQSQERLESTGVPVLGHLQELPALLQKVKPM